MNITDDEPDGIYQHQPETSACMIRRSSGGWASYRRDGPKVLHLMAAGDDTGRSHAFLGIPNRMAASFGNMWPV